MPNIAKINQFSIEKIRFMFPLFTHDGWCKYQLSDCTCSNFGVSGIHVIECFNDVKTVKKCDSITPIRSKSTIACQSPPRRHINEEVVGTQLIYLLVGSAALSLQSEQLKYYGPTELHTQQNNPTPFTPLPL
jgi:hypothetical protein